MDELEKSTISGLLQRALAKLQILNTNQVNDEILDPSETYSIRDVLDKKIEQIETFEDRLLHLPRYDPQEDRIQKQKRSFDSWQSVQKPDKWISRWHYAKLKIDIERNGKRADERKSLLNRLNTAYADNKQLAIASSCYVQKWEDARREQLIQTLELREKELREQTALGEYGMSQGLDAARKINAHYGWQLAQVEADINDWMERFDRDKDDIESRSQKARVKKKHWEEMKVLVEERTKEIERLEGLERKYSEEAEHKRMCAKFAVRIQAWWRGVMVRKGLYGKAKKGKKGKKGAKGGKKGKGKKAKK